jgi:capsid protein
MATVSLVGARYATHLGSPRRGERRDDSGLSLVGDFRRAVLFDRQDFVVSSGTVGDDFIRNIVRVLGEARLGLAVTRPAAFCNVDVVT